MSPGPIMVLPPSQRAVPDLPHDKSNVIIWIITWSGREGAERRRSHGWTTELP
jgi:hypothetical protein